MVIAYDRATSKDLTRRSVYETRGMLFVETGTVDDDPIDLDDDEAFDEGALIRQRRRQESGE
jgi:hypothetical protein